MKLLLFLLLCIVLCSCVQNKNFKVSGNFNYTKNDQQPLVKNKVGIEFKKPIYETQDKTKSYHIGGSIYHNYDLFNRSYHLNGFGQVGMEF
jgi:hypothetical protein